MSIWPPDNTSHHALHASSSLRHPALNATSSRQQQQQQPIFASAALNSLNAASNSMAGMPPMSMPADDGLDVLDEYDEDDDEFDGAGGMHSKMSQDDYGMGSSAHENDKKQTRKRSSKGTLLSSSSLLSSKARFDKPRPCFITICSFTRQCLLGQNFDVLHLPKVTCICTRAFIFASLALFQIFRV